VDYQKNAEVKLDMLDRSWNLFDRYGDVLHTNSRKVYTVLAERLQGRTVCDVGCGCGYGTAVLKNAGCDAWGLDNGAKTLTYGRCLYPWLRLEERNALAVSLKNETVDSVVCIDVIEHLENPKALVDNLCAMSKDVWIATPNKNALGMSKHCPNLWCHVQEFSPDEMLEMLSIKGEVEVFTLRLLLVPPEVVSIAINVALLYHVKVREGSDADKN